MKEMYRRLQNWFFANPRVAVAFSGGADSTFLLHAAKANCSDVRAYCVRSAFQPDWEQQDAERFAAWIGVQLTVLKLDVLVCPEIAKNGKDRCYQCKTAIMSKICAQALADGYPILVDGTNASDNADDRPGMRALGELGVRSPLRDCGLMKSDIYMLSQELGLPTAEKPAYACLATRIPTGTAITSERLRRVEMAEDLLFSEGFSDFRVRLSGDGALLQFTANDQQRYRQKIDILRPQLQTMFNEIRMDQKVRKGI